MWYNFTVQTGGSSIRTPPIRGRVLFRVEVCRPDLSGFTRVRIPQESSARAPSGFSRGLVSACGQKCLIGFRTKVSVETSGNGLRLVSARLALCQNEDTAFVNFNQHSLPHLNEFHPNVRLRPLRSAFAESFCRAWFVEESAANSLPEEVFIDGKSNNQ